MIIPNTGAESKNMVYLYTSDHVLICFCTSEEHKFHNWFKDWTLLACSLLSLALAPNDWYLGVWISIGRTSTSAIVNTAFVANFLKQNSSIIVILIILLALLGYYTFLQSAHKTPTFPKNLPNSSAQRTQVARPSPIEFFFIISNLSTSDLPRFIYALRYRKNQATKKCAERGKAWKTASCAGTDNMIA